MVLVEVNDGAVAFVVESYVKISVTQTKKMSEGEWVKISFST